MATASITKEFVIKDTKACDKLVKVLTENSRRKKSNSKKYEEGKKLLAQRYSH